MKLQKMMFSIKLNYKNATGMGSTACAILLALISWLDQHS